MKKLLLFFVLLAGAHGAFSQQTSVSLNSVQPANTTVEATQNITLLPGFETSGSFTARIVPENIYDVVKGQPYNLNENLNWISSSSFDLNGRLVASGISYFNTLGKPTQSHSLDIKTGKIWVNEVRYDEFNRPVFSTLSSPTGTSYGYKSNFITKTNGSSLTNIDIANIKNNSAAAIIGNQANTLGWYYSENNDSELYQDVTNHPYFKTIYSKLNPGIPLRVLGGNKVKRTPTSQEEWIQDYSFQLPMAQELFYAFGTGAFPEREMIPPPPVSTTLSGNAPQGFHYKYSMELCGVASPITVSNVRFIEDPILVLHSTYEVLYNGTKGYYKITGVQLINEGSCQGIECAQMQQAPPGGFAVLASNNRYNSCPYGRPTYIQGSKTVVRDVHGVETVVFQDHDGNVLASARSGNEENASVPTYKVISPINSLGFVDIHIPVGCSNAKLKGNYAGKTFKIYDLITENEVTGAISGANITLPSGFYRIQIVGTHKDEHPYAKIENGTVSLLKSESIGIEYNVNYHDFSLNFYDKANRLTSNVQPLGFDNSMSLATASRSHNLVSSFQYNTLGELQNTTSVDEGTAHFKYRKDGLIRFSQNTKQVALNQFSYTNYDELGRPVEGGVATGTFSSLNADTSVVSTSIASEKQETFYDALTSADLSFLASVHSRYGNPTFLSGNVAKTKNANTTTYYSYDIYGRVQWMVQNIPGLAGAKTIDYEYDYGTGLVTKVIFQKGVEMQSFTHRYTYNVAGELYKVETSRNEVNYTTQAVYKYYETGALKRVEIAENVQGVDYIYNLAGQLKAINHPSTTSVEDPGKDGLNQFAQDLFGFALDYYQGDYTRTNTPTTISSTTQGTNQFNGNIKAARWANSGIQNRAQAGQLYQYNKNNWLTQADFGTALSSGQITVGTDYKVNGITYDLNGNIKTLIRNKHTENGSNVMDNFTYHYKAAKPNQLDHVDDAVTSATNADDLKDQNAGNYTYNSIGQLTENTGEGVKYFYNASGLVTEIQKNNVPLLKLYYDDRGFRLKKELYSSGSLTKTEYYVRDASGNVMAIYSGNVQKEVPIYGAGRLGVYYQSLSGTGTTLYQLSDHLGNVRATVAKSDTGVISAIQSARDYYPFGMLMPGRTLNGAESYRYGYQGEYAETDPETGKPAFQLRLWDSRIGRWLSPDPYREFSSPYLGMGNNPVKLVDPNGGSTASCPDCPTGNYENGTEWIASDGSTYVYHKDFGGWSDAPQIVINITRNKKTANSAGVKAAWGAVIAAPTTGTIAKLHPVVRAGAVGVTIGAGARYLTDSAIDYFAAEYTTTITADDTLPYITLYRGVSSNVKEKDMFFEAQMGVAVPNGLREAYVNSILDAHSDFDLHAAGDNMSIFTSWTVDVETAKGFATQHGTVGGIILMKRFKFGTVFPNLSPTAEVNQEGEWLVPGIVSNARVRYVNSNRQFLPLFGN